MRSYTILLLITLLVISCKSNVSNNSKQVKNKHHLKEPNLILFSKNKLRKNDSIETKFSKHFVLNEDEFLTMHFTLDKPLIHSLQSLASNLSVDELLEKGNFQFTILVDGKVIYVENLNKGAGLVASKTTQLKHTIPLITPKQIDFWGWFMWLKFMKKGNGKDALSTGKHVLSIEVRSYLKQGKLQVGELLAKGNITVDVLEKLVDKNLISVQDIKVNSGWEVSKDYFDYTKIETLNKKIAQKRFEKINGIVVIKEGQLLIEEYFNGEERSSLHDSRSVGKTIASTMLGIAIEEKHIKNEDLELKNFYNLKSYKNYSPSKDKVTLKSLLTMSSGFLGDDSDFDNPGNEEFMYPTDNWVKFTLDLPMQKDKVMGRDFTYFTAGIVVLGDIIHKSVPNGLVSYAENKLFSPLNITNLKWQYTPQGVGNTAGGLQLRAIDFAKYGQLYKNNGKWNNKQILTKEWVKKSLAKQVEQLNFDNGFYGYLFWNKIYTVNDKNYEVSFCSGNGGNKIFIFKDIPFVVVITSSAYNLPYAHADVDKMMIDYIIPAIIAEK